MSNKGWRFLQVIAYIIIFGGGALAIFSTSEPVGDGVRRMVERPWWLNWLGGLIVLSIFTVVFVEVRSRNGGVVNARVIGQTLLWIAITVGGLMFIWYLRGDFN
ncbi:hypothetical protein [Bacillus sp. Marseille-Q3570]|uniref:hypothetical protein n=1 Tax=Bacillus sp. Marseille-Q3570 TaxID=2963522 RepID=UPI0021B7ACE0|nr:hypothetical protein [Bacillus sp. Marseille-Q3570]